MIDEEPSLRPSASTLVNHPCICPDAHKSKAQLRKELNQEKFKVQMLQRKVEKYREQMSLEQHSQQQASMMQLASGIVASNSRLAAICESKQQAAAGQKSTTTTTSSSSSHTSASVATISSFVRSYSSSTIL